MTDLEKAAWSWVGNWKSLSEFIDNPIDVESPEDWGVIWFDHSEAPCPPKDVEDAVSEIGSEDIKTVSRSHWAFGRLHGVAVRVFRDGRVTRAFEKFFDWRSKQ